MSYESIDWKNRDIYNSKGEIVEKRKRIGEMSGECNEVIDAVKRDAEAHWAYTGAVIAKASAGGLNESEMELCHYLYVQAFRHGAKHQEAGDYAENPRACSNCLHYSGRYKCLLTTRGVSSWDSCSSFDAK